jgi:hypothetical protein
MKFPNVRRGERHSLQSLSGSTFITSIFNIHIHHPNHFPDLKDVNFRYQVKLWEQILSLDANTLLLGNGDADKVTRRTARKRRRVRRTRVVRQSLMGWTRRRSTRRLLRRTIKVFTGVWLQSTTLTRKG